METARLVVELMPTIDLLAGDHRWSMWIVNHNLHMVYPITQTLIEVVRLLVDQPQSSIFESMRSDGLD
jgi:hypothetical protein